MLIQLMPSVGLGRLEDRQQTCLIKLLLLPGGKMFQGIDPLCHFIGSNDESIRNMQSIRIGKLPPQPGLFRGEFHRNARLTQA
jgi:hypothetical protein